MRELLSSLGPVTAVIGAQWGDEGKGKAVDILAEHFDVIARACGGANAGHTIVVNGKKHVFRLLPSGSLHPHVQVYLGSGMVIHLPTLLEEIDLLRAAGVEILDRLHITRNAHIVFEFHKEIDIAMESMRGAYAIGTTKRGIGPAYADKASRNGLRMEALAGTAADVRKYLESRAPSIKQMYGVTVNIDSECEAFEKAQKILVPLLTGIEQLHLWIAKKQKILIEGAQATLLDIDHGSYPHVTSSQTTAAGALQGLGLPPKILKSCIGVAKAYCTRVGGGPFPTEADEAASVRLRERGGEYGSVTKRPRRCGWLHIPDLLFSAQINGFDCWNITKIDVLDTEEVIPVGVEMEEGGKVTWKNMPGWKTSTVGITAFEKLPKEAQDYILFIEKKTGLPVKLIGTGQQRGEMIVKS
ncbi:adenylosuccinate synthase [Candidatus Peribacteria bacterium]|nr:adenylosuccinate synthase [Candidatus Peribacteria bacterium]